MRTQPGGRIRDSTSVGEGAGRGPLDLRQGGQQPGIGHGALPGKPGQETIDGDRDQSLIGPGQPQVEKMIDDLGSPGELSSDGVSNLGDDLSYTWFNHQNIMARRTARPVTRGEAALWQRFIAHGWTSGGKARRLAA